MDGNLQQSYEDFLNPALMRHRLLGASIYIAGFQALKDAIISRIREFFRTGFDDSGDKFDPKYRTDVLSRDKSPLYASLGWLKEMGAVDDPDIGAFDRIKTCRNILAHRLFETLGTEGMPPDFEKCFHEMVTLLRKVEVWWIVNVDIPTNPDFDGQEVDEKGIAPGRVLGLQLLCDLALGDEQKSRYYLEEFRKRTREA